MPVAEPQVVLAQLEHPRVVKRLPPSPGKLRLQQSGESLPSRRFSPTQVALSPERKEALDSLPWTFWPQFYHGDLHPPHFGSKQQQQPVNSLLFPVTGAMKRWTPPKDPPLAAAEATVGPKSSLLG